jgi:hypothetical protein
MTMVPFRPTGGSDCRRLCVAGLSGPCLLGLCGGLYAYLEDALSPDVPMLLSRELLARRVRRAVEPRPCRREASGGGVRIVSGRHLSLASVRGRQ